MSAPDLPAFSAHCDHLLDEHLEMLKQDYTFPLGPEDSVGLYKFLFDMGNDEASRALMAQILVGATRRLSRTGAPT